MNSTKLYSEITCVAWHFLIVRHCISYSYIHGPAVRYLCSRSPNQAFWLHHAQSIYLRPNHTHVRIVPYPCVCRAVPTVSYPCTYRTIPMYLPYRTHVPTVPYRTHVPTARYHVPALPYLHPFVLYLSVSCTAPTVTSLRWSLNLVLSGPHKIWSSNIRTNLRFSRFRASFPSHQNSFDHRKLHSNQDFRASAPTPSHELKPDRWNTRKKIDFVPFSAIALPFCTLPWRL